MVKLLHEIRGGVLAREPGRKFGGTPLRHGGVDGTPQVFACTVV